MGSKVSELILGSPYWCTKAFACLAASADHPFWASEELPWPKELFSPRKALPDPSHIMNRLGGHTFLLSSGQYPHYAMRHGPEKYCKFAYSSTFGFSCATGDMDLEQTAADSMLALMDGSECDGETWRVRRKTLDGKIVGRGTPEVHLRGGWKPWPDVTVETILIPPQEASPNYYIRLHKIVSGRPLKTSEAGWSTFGQGADGRALVQAFSGEKSGGIEEIGWTRASTATGTVGIVDMTGKRRGRLVQSDPNSNVIFSRSVLPSLLGDIEKGETILATAIYGLPGSGDPEETWGKEPVVPEWARKAL